MILEITNVQRDGLSPDDYLVAGKVAGRQLTVSVQGKTVDERLKALGAKKARSDYELRDLAPLIAQLATHDLSQAFHAPAISRR